MADSVRDAIDSIRGTLQAELDAQLGTLAERQAAELERRTAEIRAAVEADAERRVAAAKTAALAPGSLAHAFREIDAAASLSSILTCIQRAVASVSPRAAIFVGSAASLERWSDGGGTAGGELPAVRRVVQTGAQSRAGGVLIVPLLLDGVCVGAVEAELAEGDASSTVEAIVRYGAARLASVTALRTVQAQHWLRSGTAAARTGLPGSSSEETDPAHGLHQ